MRMEIASFAFLNLDTAVLRSCEPAFIFFIASLHLLNVGADAWLMRPPAAECLFAAFGSGLLKGVNLHNRNKNISGDP